MAWFNELYQQITILLKHPVSQFLLGVRLCVQGCLYALANKRVWAEHRRCFKILLAIILCIYFICFLVYIPIYISLYFVSFLVDVEKWVGNSTLSQQAWLIFASISFYIPLVIVFVTQYLLPSFSEDVFFATFSLLDPSRSEVYHATKPVGFWALLWRRVKRFLRLSLWSIAAYCLSFLPGVGWMVFPAAQFYMISKIFGLKTGIAFSFLILFPPLHVHSWSVVKVLFGARALAIETLDPYFSRFGYDKIKMVERQYQPVLLGFATPFLFLMAVPILGPLFWGMVQASASVLLLATELN